MPRDKLVHMPGLPPIKECKWFSERSVSVLALLVQLTFRGAS